MSNGIFHTSMGMTKDIVVSEKNSENKLKAIDKSRFKDANIDVKIKFSKTFDVSELEQPKAVKVFDVVAVEERFKAFCQEKGYDYSSGSRYLKEFLNKKND